MRSFYSLSKLSPLSLAISFIMLNQSIYAEESIQQNKLAPIVMTAESNNTEDSSYITTATKTALPLQLSLKETPQSVSIVTSQRMNDQDLNDVSEVAENVTGVFVNRFESNRGSIYSRGFQVDNYQIDGIATTYSNQWSAGEIFNSTAIMERVEVVRGATGLMTGAGNPSASINMIRKKASSNVPKGSIEVSGGTWDQVHLMGDVSNSLNPSGSLRGRAVVSYDESDSFRTDYKKDIFTGLLTAEADLTENTVLTAGLSYQNEDTHAPTWGALPATYSNGKQIHWNRSTTTAPEWARWETEYTSLFTNLTHTFANDWQLTASYDHGDRRAHSKLLYVYGTPDELTGVGVAGGMGQYLTTTKQDTASIQLSGEFNLLDRQHDFALGYQYSNQDFNSDYRPVQCADIATNPWCSVNIDHFYTWDRAKDAEPNWGDTTFYQQQNIKQNSFYAVSRWSLFDPLKLILGARLTDYARSGNGLFQTAYAQKFEHQLIPYAGLIYEINPHFSAYASYTSIFQPQQKKDIRGQYLDPVEGDNYEIGLKATFIEDRVNANLSVFNIKQEKYGVDTGETQDFGNGPETIYRASTGSQSEGFDFEVTGDITQDWNLSAGYAQFRLTDETGKQIDRDRPNKVANLFTSYKLSESFPLTVGAGLRWQGETVYNVVNGTLKQDSLAIVNLMVRYQFNPEFSAQVNVNNVGDKNYYTISAQQVSYNEPRNATLMLKYKF